MTKYFVSLALVSQLVSSIHATSVDPFEKLRPKISRQAQSWAAKVATTVGEDLQVAYLNLFALNTEELLQSFIKCAEFIEAQSDKLSLYEELGTGIMDILKKYAENFQEKIALKKNITEKETEILWQKLEMKIQDLVMYINAIYYQTLYQLVVKRNTSSLMYMFDNNGIIPREKRIKSLPRSL